MVRRIVKRVDADVDWPAWRRPITVPAKASTAGRGRVDAYEPPRACERGRIPTTADASRCWPPTLCQGSQSWSPPLSSTGRRRARDGLGNKRPAGLATIGLEALPANRASRDTLQAEAEAGSAQRSTAVRSSFRCKCAALCCRPSISPASPTLTALLHDLRHGDASASEEAQGDHRRLRELVRPQLCPAAPAEPPGARRWRSWSPRT